MFDREYATAHFPNDNNQQISFPRHLTSNSKFDHLIKPLDNSVEIKDITAEAFEDLIHFLSSEHVKLEPSHITKLINSATQIGLCEAKNKLQKIQKIFNNSQ